MQAPVLTMSSLCVQILVLCLQVRAGLPSGVALLDKLYDSVAEADAAAAPLLERLFLATWQPYAEHLEAWLFTPEALPSSAPFMAPAPAGIQAMLPETAASKPSVRACPPDESSNACQGHHLFVQP